MNSDNDSSNHEATVNRDFLTQFGPIDKLLGSVSYSDIDSGDNKQQQQHQQQPVRASARVFKKMKFDQTISSTTATTTVTATNVTLTTTPTTATTTTITTTTVDTVADAAEHCNNNTAIDKKDDDNINNNKQETVTTKSEIKKTVNTQWSFEEKIIFFEALNEYGKDFENIHIYMLQRLKKKGVPDEHIKTKHQIRHYYYKTVSSFLRYLKISDKVPKTAQEIYALINYGELWRKIGSVSKKNWPKLNELINNGSIALRIKGKTIRIKTPMCRALRRLNQLDEKYDDLKLPTRVLVELRPKNMSAFLKVQSMAQNPRIKMAISLQKRLSSLISCISARWKTTDNLIYDKAIVATNPITNNYVPDQQTIKTNQLLLQPLLRVTPIDNARIELPSIDISEYFTGQSICLNAFEARKVIKNKDKNKDPITIEKPELNKSPIKQLLDDNNDGIKDDDKINKITVDTFVDNAVNIILSLKTDNNKNNNDTDIITIDTDDDGGGGGGGGGVIDEDNEPDIVNNNNNHNNNNNKQEEKLKKIKEIKRGWTLENCGSLTIGELYLMFGSGSKLILEYTWDDLPRLKQENTREDTITQSLKKLLSLARLQYNQCYSSSIVTNGTPTVTVTTPITTTSTTSSTTTTTSTAAITTTTPTSVNSPITTTTTLIDTTTTTTTTTIASPTIQTTTDKCLCGHSCGNINNLKTYPVQFKKPINKTTKKTHNDVEENETQTVDDETVPQPPVVNLFTQFDIQRLNPLNRNNKRRPRSKQWVVERKLVPNQSETKHQIVSMDIVPQINVNKSNSDRTIKIHDQNDIRRDLNFLEHQSNSTLSTSGLSDILKTGDGQWMSTDDVGDFSLSSLLGRLDYQKTNQSMITNSDTQLSTTDVDAQLHTMLIETSIDYTEKFADLAAQVIDNKKS